MSLINALKSRGPRTDPWGTPERISKGEDSTAIIVIIGKEVNQKEHI
jgi:hypothetical protein